MKYNSALTPLLFLVGLMGTFVELTPAFAPAPAPAPLFQGTNCSGQNPCPAGCNPTTLTSVQIPALSQEFAAGRPSGTLTPLVFPKFNPGVAPFNSVPPGSILKAINITTTYTATGRSFGIENTVPIPAPCPTAANVAPGSNPVTIQASLSAFAPHQVPPIYQNPTFGKRHAALPVQLSTFDGNANQASNAPSGEQQCPIVQYNAGLFNQYVNQLLPIQAGAQFDPAQDLLGISPGGSPDPNPLLVNEQSGFSVCWTVDTVESATTCVDNATLLNNFYIGAGTFQINTSATDASILNLTGVCAGNDDAKRRIKIKGRADISYVFCPPCSLTANDAVVQACVGGNFVDFCLPISVNCGTFICQQGAPANPSIPAPPAGGGSFVVQGSCATGCLIRYTPPLAAYAGPFTFSVTYSATANGTAGGTCSDTGLITVNLCKVDAGDTSGSVCAGQSTTAPICLPITLSGSCGPVSCGNITVGTITPAGSGVTATVVACPSGGCALQVNATGVGASVTNVSIPYTYAVSLGSGLPTCTDSGVVTVGICRVTAPPATVNACVGGRNASICIAPTATCGGNPVTIPCSSITFTQPAAGQGTVSGPGANCSGGNCPGGGNGCCLTYTPPATLPAGGFATFTYTACSPTISTCCATATVTVNLCQVTAPNTCANVCPGGAVTFCLPMSTAGASCGTIPCTLSTGATVAGVQFTQPPAAQGTIALSTGCGTCGGCCVTFTAAAGVAVNSVSIPYTARTNGNPICSANGVITVNICRIVAPDVAQSTCATCPTTFCLPIATTGSSCPGVSDCPTVPCQVSTGAGVPGIQFTQPPAGQGTIALATGSCGTCIGCCVTYTPPATFPQGVNSVSIPYTARATGTGCSASGTITINVCRIVTLPLVTDICQCEPQKILDVLANVSVTGTGCGTINCHSLTILTPPDPSTGTAIVDPACANSGNPCTSCKIIFTPNANFVGVATFTYSVGLTNNPCCIGTGQVSVNVRCCPVALDDCVPPPAAPGGTITIDPLANDSVCNGGGTDCGTIGQAVITITQQPQFGTVTLITLPPDNLHVPPLPSRPGFSYTANNPFPPTGDRICYTIRNTCNCTSAPACVQITLVCGECKRNRDECASLLLYPEYDNRTGSRTLITITDACCGTPAENTKIELVFINRNGCFEFNRTYILSPCDTLSLITSFVAPQGFQGYLYVFAKNSVNTAANPNGTPIVFNHLIGQSLSINGINNFEYAINAVAFKGLGPEGAANDDDNDGIRDLNGPGPLAEYEEAPDKILIPRFFGQDPNQPGGGGNGPFRSDIVLVALTGGSAFTTLVDIAGFNDNEQPFSGLYSFQCWDKVALSDFSAGTLQSTLIALGDNPNEIIGWPNPKRKTGWMTLNGLVATSSVETILDPAIYAVLIEQGLGAFKVADLPWEVCFQTNGDLLPHSVLGDGPNPVDNDNQ